MESLEESRLSRWLRTLNAIPIIIYQTIFKHVGNREDITYRAIYDILEANDDTIVSLSDAPIHIGCAKYVTRGLPTAVQLRELVATINGRREIQSLVIAFVRTAIDSGVIPVEIFEEEAVDMNWMEKGGVIERNMARLRVLIPMLGRRWVGIAEYEAHVVWLAWVVSLARSRGRQYARRRELAKVAQSCDLEIDESALSCENEGDIKDESDERYTREEAVERQTNDNDNDNDDTRKEEEDDTEEFQTIFPDEIPRSDSGEWELRSYDSALPMSMAGFDDNILRKRLAKVPFVLRYTD